MLCDRSVHKLAQADIVTPTFFKEIKRLRRIFGQILLIFDESLPTESEIFSEKKGLWVYGFLLFYVGILFSFSTKVVFLSQE